MTGPTDVSDVLVDSDLTLRRAVPADAADIREVYNEPDIQLWMLWEPEKYDEAEALANIERSEEAWAEGSNAPFRIVADGHVVGGANLNFRGHQVARSPTSCVPRRAAAAWPPAPCCSRPTGTSASVGWPASSCASTRPTSRRSPWPSVPGSSSRVSSAARRPTPTAAASTPCVYSLLPSERVAIRPATSDDAEFLTDTAITATEAQGRFPADVDRADTEPASSTGLSSSCASTSRQHHLGCHGVRRRHRPSSRRADRDTRRAGRPPAAARPPGQGDRHSGHPRLDGRSRRRPAVRSGCRWRRTTPAPRRCTNGSGWSSSARMATST